MKINRILCLVDFVGLIRSLSWTLFKPKDTRTPGPCAVSNQYQRSTYQIEIIKTHAADFFCAGGIELRNACWPSLAQWFEWWSCSALLSWIVGIYFEWTMIEAMGCSDIVDEVCVFVVYLSMFLRAYICWHEMREFMRFPYCEWYIDCLLPESPDSGLKRHVIFMKGTHF